MSQKSEAEDLLATHLTELGLNFHRQVQVISSRKWAWDFVVWNAYTRITMEPIDFAIEVDGYFKGRHGAGWGADNEKRNVGTAIGDRLFVFSTNDVLRGDAKKFLQEWVLR